MDKAKGKNHFKVCWYRGKETIQPDKRGCVCSNCGATYNNVPGLTSPGRGCEIYSTKPIF